MSTIALTKIKSELLSGKPFRIVFLGDSVTQGDDTHLVWPSMVTYVLRDKLSDIVDKWQLAYWNLRMINSGFNSATSADILRLLDQGALSFKPSMVFCMIGKNDRMFKKGPVNYRKNIFAILKKLKLKVPRVILAPSAPAAKDSINEEFEKYVEEVATIFPLSGVEFVDIFHKFQENDYQKYFTCYNQQGNMEEGIEPGSWDFLHPNTYGQAHIAKIFLKEVFGIDFNADQYAKDVLADVMYPNYSL